MLWIQCLFYHDSLPKVKLGFNYTQFNFTLQLLTEMLFFCLIAYKPMGIV